MAKKSNLMKIGAVTIVLLFLISGFSLLTYGYGSEKSVSSSGISETIYNTNFIPTTHIFKAKTSIPIENNSLYINNFSVYYGSIVNQSIINELNNYSLVILQHWAFTKQELSEIKSIKIAYIDLGEYDNSTYPNCTINLTGIVIGKDSQWNQTIVNVSSPQWINYTVCRVKYDISMGFNGVMFDDIDVVEQYPWEAQSMIKIISIIHQDFPNLIIGVNRGFELINNIYSYIKFVLYEDFGTFYNFTSNSYEFLNESEIIHLENLTNEIKSLGLTVLGLGYSPEVCSYYTYYDYQLGKELDVPVYISNWNLSDLYSPCNVTYAITFTESGLSSGTSWSVTLNNIEKSSTNGTIIFNEPNGSYSYTISSISGYRASTYSGTINVNGNPVSNSITWTIITYPITITENGIPNGTSWSATLTGTAFNGQYINITLTSTTNTVTFNEPNGSYSYIIHLPSGYQSNNVKGPVNVSGNSAIVSFKVQQTFKTQQTTNYLSIGIIGVIIIIVISLGVTFLMRNRNKQKVMKQKEPPKES